MDELQQIPTSSVPLDGDVHTLVLGCSDGRFTRALADLLENHLHLPPYDQVFVPGGAGCLTSHLALRHEEALQEQLALLVRAHNIRRIILLSHQDCGFYAAHIRMGPEMIERKQLADLERAHFKVRDLATGLESEAHFVRFQGNEVFLDRIA